MAANVPAKRHGTPIRVGRKQTTKASVLVRIAALLGVLYGVCALLDSVKERWYIFEPQSMHDLAKSAVEQHGNDTASMVHSIVSTLSDRYPEWTVNSNFAADGLSVSSDGKVSSYAPNSDEWVWNNAGGAMGHMFIIHASITEYLIIFGTPLGTEGHTGRHTADDYFHILSGEQWAAKAGAFDIERYPAGSVHHLVRGQVKQYKFHEGGFALEYARGWIPLMLPFGFADTFFSTLDLPTLWQTVWLTGREMVKNLLHGKI